MTTQAAETVKARWVGSVTDFSPCVTFIYGGMFIIGEIKGFYVGYSDKEYMIKKGVITDLDKMYAKPRIPTEPIPVDYVPPF